MHSNFEERLDLPFLKHGRKSLPNAADGGTTWLLGHVGNLCNKGAIQSTCTEFSQISFPRKSIVSGSRLSFYHLAQAVWASPGMSHDRSIARIDGVQLVVLF